MEDAKIPRSVIDKLFELGVMGIEVPETHGGAGGTFFQAVLAVEALSSVDPSIGVLVDVQNTLVVNALARWGNNDIKRRYLRALATSTVGAYALSEAGSGSDAFAMTTRAVERDAKADGPDLFVCWMQKAPARQLVNLKNIPVMVMSAEASYHQAYDHCTAKYLNQAGVKTEYIRLQDKGVHGNGHMVMIEMNNLEVARVVDEWVVKNVK